MLDTKRALASDNIQVQPALHVGLAGSGIRSIEHDSTEGAFQNIASHPSAAEDFRLVTWACVDGPAREVRRFSGQAVIDVGE